MTTLSEGARDTTEARRFRVMLAIEAAGDRRVVQSWLSEDHDVVLADTEDPLTTEFDLCVLDEPAFARVWNEIGARKRESEPVFLPFVLLVSKRSAHLLAHVPTHDVDEVLEAPIGRDVVLERLGVLLDRRRRERTLYEAREAAMAQLRASIETERRRAELADALTRIDQELHSAQDREKVIWRAVREGAEALGADSGAVSERDDGFLVVWHAHGFPEDISGTAIPVEREPHSLLALETKRPVVIEDVSSDDRVDSAHLRKYGVAAVIVVPLLIGGEARSNLYYNFSLPRRVLPEEVEFAERLGSSLSLALENNRLLEEQRLRRQRVQALHGVMQVAVSSLDPRMAAQRILDYLCHEHGFELANVWLAEDEALRLLAATNYPDAYGERFSPMPLDARYDAPRVFHAGEAIAVEDAADANPRVREMYAEIGVELGAYAIVPLESRGRTIGTLHFGWSRPRAITESDMAFYASLGAQLGVVLENARLYEQRSREAQYAEALNRIDAAIHSTLQFDEIMKRIVVEMTDALGVDGAAVHMRRHHHWEFAYTHRLPQVIAEARLTDEEATLSAHVLATGQPIATSDLEHDERVNAELMKRFGITSLLVVPLIVRGEALGVIFAACTGGKKRFTEDHLTFANKAALTLALALRNAQLYESEHNVATQLQEALLALPEEIPGIEFAREYRSATESMRVGGDFYDLFELNHSHIGITIGDVSGKGLDAAMLTSLAKNTIRAHAAEAGKTPARILALANEVLHRATSAETFVTLFFGILDCRDGRLVYANGGHTSAVVLTDDGECRTLPATGPILGAFAAMGFEDKEAWIGAEDALFLYTDGLTEARSDGGFYGEEGVIASLKATEDRTARGVVDRALRDVLSFTGGRLSDDLAILAVTRGAPSTTLPSQQKLTM